MSEHEQEALSRRSLLRRSAAVGAALVWTTPAIQSLSPLAHAVGSQVGTCTDYVFKFELDRDILQADDGAPAPGHWANGPSFTTFCLSIPAGTAYDNGGAHGLPVPIVQFLSGDKGRLVMAIEDCDFVSGFSKCGSGGCELATENVDGTVTFFPCHVVQRGNDKILDISHIELIACC